MRDTARDESHLSPVQLLVHWMRPCVLVLDPKLFRVTKRSSYFGHMSPTVKPFGKGSLGSRTCVLIPVIHAVPVIAGTMAG